MKGQDMLVRLNVNGEWREADVWPGASLMSMLRDDLGLWGTKNGCEQEPHSPCSQPFFVPHRPRSSRSIDIRLAPGHTSASRHSPFTFTRTCMSCPCLATPQLAP